MAGLYIHIPFCKSRCIYCGFYSTTRHPLRQRYVDALCRELALRSDYLDEPIETVYLGGGTPSMLSSDQLEKLFQHIDTHTAREITIECNPDDVTPQLARLLSELPVNRVSMGAQTFNDERLRFIRRRHTSEQVFQAVENLRQAGIINISLDLMYGFPNERLEDVDLDIDNLLKTNVKHISCYSLMFEEDTPLYQLLQTGKIAETDEELSRQMYYRIVDRLTAAGYEHYEISNLALPGFRSQHNSSYWHDVPYLGIGAAAHSYDRKSRQWNVADIERYIDALEHDQLPFESELLDDDTRYNERVMTALRTSDGLPLDVLSVAQRHYLLQQSQRYLDDHLLVLADNRLRLTREGLFVSDMIMTDLMSV